MTMSNNVAVYSMTFNVFFVFFTCPKSVNEYNNNLVLKDDLLCSCCCCCCCCFVEFSGQIESELVRWLGQ